MRWGRPEGGVFTGLTIYNTTFSCSGQRPSRPLPGLLQGWPLVMRLAAQYGSSAEQSPAWAQHGVNFSYTPNTTLCAPSTTQVLVSQFTVHRRRRVRTGSLLDPLRT